MRKILVIILAVFCYCMYSCEYPTGALEYILTQVDNLFTVTHSIEKDGLKGVDTFAFARDKKQIAASFLANIDTLWVQLSDSIEENDPRLFLRYRYFRNDPTGVYEKFISYFHGPDDDYMRLRIPVRPKDFYHSYTDLIVYNKDKTLCWAFVVLRIDEDLSNFYSKYTLPVYYAYSVIGVRKNIRDAFKIFIRDRIVSYNGSENNICARTVENAVLYTPGMTYSRRDVYKIYNEDKLPVLSDPDFFEKHPLFKKHNDSTYNFEMYNANAYGKWVNTPKPVRYNYPF